MAAVCQSEWQIQGHQEQENNHAWALLLMMSSRLSLKIEGKKLMPPYLLTRQLFFKLSRYYSQIRFTTNNIIIYIIYSQLHTCSYKLYTTIDRMIKSIHQTLGRNSHNQLDRWSTWRTTPSCVWHGLCGHNSGRRWSSLYKQGTESDSQAI